VNLKAIVVLTLLSSFALAFPTIDLTTNTTDWLTSPIHDYDINLSISLNTTADLDITASPVNFNFTTLDYSYLNFSSISINNSDWVCETNYSFVNCTAFNPKDMYNTSLNLVFTVNATSDGNYTIAFEASDNQSTPESNSTTFWLALDNSTPTNVPDISFGSMNDSGANFTWTAATDVESGVAYYMVFINESDASANLINIANVSSSDSLNYTNYSLTYDYIYNITVTPVDVAGLVGENTTYKTTTIKDTTAPTATISASASGFTVGGSTTLTVTAADISTISEIQIQENDITIKTCPFATTCAISRTPPTGTTNYKGIVKDNSTAHNPFTTGTVGVVVNPVIIPPSGGGGSFTPVFSTPTTESTATGSGSCASAIGVCLYITSPEGDTSITAPVLLELVVQADECEITTDNRNSSKKTVDTPLGSYNESISLANGDHTFSVTCSLTTEGLTASKTRSVSFEVSGQVTATPVVNTTTAPVQNTTNQTAVAADTGDITGLAAAAQPAASFLAFVVIIAIGYFALRNQGLVPDNPKDVLDDFSKMVGRTGQTRLSQHDKQYRRPGLDRRVRLEQEKEKRWVDSDIKAEEKRLRGEQERLDELKRRLDDLKRQKR
jgi:hypothetical protein